MGLLGPLRRLGDGKESGVIHQPQRPAQGGSAWRAEIIEGGNELPLLGVGALGYFQRASGYEFWSQTARVQILASSLLGCVTLGKLLNLSEPQFPPL